MSMKLVILGLLLEGDKHPYEMQQIIKQRKMDRYIKFQKGSLYYAVNQLEKSNHIEIVNIIRETKRPDKTIYTITEKGKKEFNILLKKQFSTYVTYCNPINSALTFINQLSEDEIIPMIEKRIYDTENVLKSIKEIYKDSESKLNKGDLFIFLGTIRQIEYEIIWLKDILKEAVEGNLTD